MYKIEQMSYIIKMTVFFRRMDAVVRRNMIKIIFSSVHIHTSLPISTRFPKGFPKSNEQP